MATQPPSSCPIPNIQKHPLCLLDLFCGAGGAAVGYSRAGFTIVGVDNRPQPNYPFEFHEADALTFSLAGFDAVHASPPCQAFSTQTAKRGRHTDLIALIRGRLCIPYVIENVPTAPLHSPVRLCGSSFGLNLRRHRHFEVNWPLRGKPCNHTWQTPRFRSLDFEMVKKGRLASVVGVHGHINYPGEFRLRCHAMGISWMSNAELVEAVPPAYAEYVGRQLARFLKAEHGD